MYRVFFVLIVGPLLACNNPQSSPTASSPDPPGIAIRVTGAAEDYQDGDTCEEPLALLSHTTYTSTLGANFLIYEGVVKNVSGVEIRDVKVVAHAFDTSGDIIGQGDSWIGIQKGLFLYLPVDHSEYFNVSLNGFNLETRADSLDVKFYVSANGFQSVGHE